VRLPLHPSLFQRLGALALLCACLLSAANTVHQGVEAYSRTAVELAAIDTPKSLETCHHHPQGCPKDCFCPKTTVRVEAAEDASAPVSGILQESSWVNCNEEGSTSTAPAYAVFVAEPGVHVFLTMLIVGTVAQATRGEVRAVSNPPQKIPIV
jgi:hypothetical protein